MKRFIMTTIMLSTVAHATALCQGIRIGLDIGTAICIDAVKIDAEYGFMENWSAGGEISMDISMMKRTITTDEYDHRKEFATDTSKAVTDSFPDSGIFVQYWPQKTFIGPSIYLGVGVKAGYKADCIVGAAYSYNIWKGIGTGIMFRLVMIETMKSQKLSPNSLQIKLYYAF